MTDIWNELFPITPRVIYANAPLVEVVCQLRFPQILRIEGQVPAEFQDRIRNVFPLFQRGGVSLFQQVPAELAQLINSNVNAVNHQFLTEDRSATVTLTPGSIALSTTAYRRWEQFRDQLQQPLLALIEIYRPSFFERVGLRYVNSIERGRLNLTERRWSELLSPKILGELSIPQFESHLEDARRILRIKMPGEAGSVLLQHGLGTVQGRSETGYTIDFDFYTAEKTEVQNAAAILDSFHERAGRAFRWCITDLLHNALQPNTVGVGSNPHR